MTGHPVIASEAKQSSAGVERRHFRKERQVAAAQVIWPGGRAERGLLRFARNDGNAVYLFVA